jgi:hypothetical protein
MASRNDHYSILKKRGFVFLFLFLIAGIVSQPGTLSYLELGWILTPDGQPHTVQDVDFKVILLK